MCSHQQMLERKASREASFSPFVDVFGNYFHSPFHVTTITGIELKSKIPKRDHKKQKMVAVKVTEAEFLNCGDVFFYDNAKGQNKKCCSTSCAKTVGAKAAGEARKAKPSVKAMSNCVVCETPFSPSDRPNGNPTTCSRECTAWLNNPTKTGPVTKVKPCNECGKYHSNEGKFCGDVCKDVAAVNSEAIARERKRAASIARNLDGRHAIHGGEVRHRFITARYLYHLHGGCCILCGEEVEEHLGKGYQPRGWSIGHILPVSLGGSSCLANVWLECCECNSAKGEYVVYPNEFAGLTKAEKYAYMINHEDLFRI